MWHGCNRVSSSPLLNTRYLGTLVKASQGLADACLYHSHYKGCLFKTCLCVLPHILSCTSCLAIRDVAVIELGTGVTMNVCVQGSRKDSSSSLCMGLLRNDLHVRRSFCRAGWYKRKVWGVAVLQEPGRGRTNSKTRCVSGWVWINGYMAAWLLSVL